MFKSLPKRTHPQRNSQVISVRIFPDPLLSFHTYHKHMNFELAVSVTFGFVLSHIPKRDRPYKLFCDLFLFITEIFPCQNTQTTLFLIMAQVLFNRMDTS